MENIFNIVLIVLGIIQIIMIVKFFEITDDIKNIRYGFDMFIKGKHAENINETLTEKVIDENTANEKTKKILLNLLGRHGAF